MYGVDYGGDIAVDDGGGYGKHTHTVTQMQKYAVTSLDMMSLQAGN